MTYQRGEFQLASIKNLLYSDSVLFHQIWTPQLMKAIGDAKKVYFAPDGFLHQLAIEYMIPDTLIDCYRLSSTRVLTKKKEPVNYSKLLVCGGMNLTPLAMMCGLIISLQEKDLSMNCPVQ